MKDQFATYEISKKLKELGFKEPCLRGYDKNEMLFYSEQENGHYLNYSIGMNMNAPLWQQVFDWLREKHGLFVKIDHVDTTTQYYYDYTIITAHDREYHDEDSIDQAKRHYYFDEFDTFEKTREQAILKAIKLIKL